MSPRIELDVHSIGKSPYTIDTLHTGLSLTHHTAYDETNLILYVSMHQIFSIFLVPFHHASVDLTTVLKLRAHPDLISTGPTKFHITSQNDLYAPDQFLRFLFSGFSDWFVWGWQAMATLFCLLGALAFAPVSWWEEKYGPVEFGLGIPRGIGRTVKELEGKARTGARLLTASAVQQR